MPSSALRNFSGLARTAPGSERAASTCAVSRPAKPTGSMSRAAAAGSAAPLRRRPSNRPTCARSLGWHCRSAARLQSLFSTSTCGAMSWCPRRSRARTSWRNFARESLERCEQLIPHDNRLAPSRAPIHDLIHLQISRQKFFTIVTQPRKLADLPAPVDMI